MPHKETKEETLHTYANQARAILNKYKCQDTEKCMDEHFHEILEAYRIERNKQEAPDESKNERFFMIFYSGVNDDFGTSKGFIQVTTDGSYINCEITIKQIKDIHKNVKNAVIDNIIELTKSDYDYFNFTNLNK